MTEPVPTTSEPPGPIGPKLAIALSAAAGGMGWGIRGSFGHETGAMIAGVLVGLVAVLAFLPRASSLKGARAVALLALGISFGGSMTYGRTLGLTHGPNAVGDWDALRLGMTGVAIKGAVWFGFGGLFLGMGMGRTRYRPLEGLGIVGATLGLAYLGIWALNTPFDPVAGEFPRWFFSGDWPPPEGPDPKARPEVWGGLLFALIGQTAYCRFVRGDRLAGRMALAGFLAGGVGFPVGQSVQAFHGWNLQTFRTGWFAPYDKLIGWWNMMEITFGAVGGAGLAAGLVANRSLISDDEPADAVSISPLAEFALLVVHIVLLVGAEFSRWPYVGLFLSLGPTVAVVALPAILGGRYWPYLYALAVVAVPIAGKTFKHASIEDAVVPIPLGMGFVIAAPLIVLTVAALVFAVKGTRGATAGRYATAALPLAAWTYYGLILTSYQFPWPWEAWTSRTPSALIYTVCVAALTVGALRAARGRETGA